MGMPIPLHAIDAWRARRRLRDRVRHTPLQHSPSLSQRVGAPIHLKLECLQITGSFKLRGATHALLTLDEAARARGVVAVSTGNHGRALAHAACMLGVRAVICMSQLVPQNKRDAIVALGAEVHISGNSQDEAGDAVERLVQDEGLTRIPPFDDARVIAGQATLGLELLDDLPTLQTVLVPLSGGGLLAGVALAVKAAAPAARVIGVSMEHGCAMHASLAAGHPVQVQELPSLADSLGGGIGLHNQYTLAMVQALVDDTLLVSEAEIARGIAHAYHAERLIVEGAGAVGIAALLAGRVPNPGRTAVVVSGANIDMTQHRQIITSTAPA